MVHRVGAPRALAAFLLLAEGDPLNEIWPRQRAMVAQYWQGGLPQTAAGIR